MKSLMSDEISNVYRIVWLNFFQPKGNPSKLHQVVRFRPDFGNGKFSISYLTRQSDDSLSVIIAMNPMKEC